VANRSNQTGNWGDKHKKIQMLTITVAARVTDDSSIEIMSRQPKSGQDVYAKGWRRNQ
jgi:hypothetical protein